MLLRALACGFSAQKRTEFSDSEKKAQGGFPRPVLKSCAPLGKGHDYVHLLIGDSDFHNGRIVSWLANKNYSKTQYNFGIDHPPPID